MNEKLTEDTVLSTYFTLDDGDEETLREHSEEEFKKVAVKGMLRDV